MRISLNLATQPYVELGPVYFRLRVLIAALAILVLPLWFLVRAEKQKAQVAQTRLTAVQAQTSRVRNQEISYEASMREPENAAVLQQSKFLNQLFREKSFSWTAVMMDLENVLPAGVQVENIDPIISRAGAVTIHLRVNGQHDRAVELVRNLEHSRRFLMPRLAGETAVTTSLTGRGIQPADLQGVNFDILAEYNPLPVLSAKRASPKQPSRGASKTAARAAAPSAAAARHRRTHRRRRSSARSSAHSLAEGQKASSQ